MGNSFIFQHDNDPKHTAGKVKACLDRKTHDKSVSAMDLPPQNQDLNITEAVWDHLDRERNKRQPTSDGKMLKHVVGSPTQQQERTTEIRSYLTFYS